MKYWQIILIISVLAVSCQKEEVHLYLGKDYVQFEEGKFNSYTFITKGDSVVRDTVWLPAFCTGSLGKEVRTFRVKQKTQYAFKYHYDETGDIVDSVLVKQQNQAEPGVHYVNFEDSGYQNLCQVEADSVYFKVPVILMRDLSLKTRQKTLSLEFVGNENFHPGDPKTKIALLKISDMLIYPEAWSDYTTTPSNVGKSSIFGMYGKVKHKLLIDVTGKPWDNEFIDLLSKEEKLFYKNLAAKELHRINSIRAEAGDPPLREDPNNPNSTVVFP